jgi:uncharacterized protein (UPF0332 family)
MPLILAKDRLIHVSKSKTILIKNWEEGISLHYDSGLTISELICLVAVDRWRLAFEHRRQANKVLELATPLYRCAVSRYYYAMYHSMRACEYVYHRGDDYEKHMELPKNIPPDFDPGVNWQNKLKDAREIRNSADYDPYPKSDSAWRKNALALRVDADQLLSLTRNYLQNKGCTI